MCSESKNENGIEFLFFFSFDSTLRGCRGHALVWFCPLHALAVFVKVWNKCITYALILPQQCLRYALRECITTFIQKSEKICIWCAWNRNFLWWIASIPVYFGLNDNRQGFFFSNDQHNIIFNLTLTLIPCQWIYGAYYVWIYVWSLNVFNSVSRFTEENFCLDFAWLKPCIFTCSNHVQKSFFRLSCRLCFFSATIGKKRQICVSECVCMREDFESTTFPDRKLICCIICGDESDAVSDLQHNQTKMPQGGEPKSFAKMAS